MALARRLKSLSRHMSAITPPCVAGVSKNVLTSLCHVSSADLVKMKMKSSLFTEDDKKQAEAYKENSTKSGPNAQVE